MLDCAGLKQKSQGDPGQFKKPRVYYLIYNLLSDLQLIKQRKVHKELFDKVPDMTQ